ncbi:MAG: hypothetical protein OXN94_07375 [Chloroflexota bacterium]|nr:hypothetical protein [Chloroflexota bacterium]MDE2857652.1 hypothetical protein [Chloroflexota bacterium]MDE2949943.1 hypothetical protein [Chloroflexota bacterium]
MDNNRNTWFLAFILLALGAVALLGNSFPVILVLLGLLFLVRQFDNDSVSSNVRDQSYDYSYDYEHQEEEEDDYDDYEIFHQQPASAEQRVYRHALESVTRAGLDPDEVQVLAVDIGLLTTKEDTEPQIYRTWSLPDDIDYIQPFVQLRVPMEANGDIRFEIIDAVGDPVYIHEDTFKLTRGRNFLTPNTRMPLHDQMELDGKWSLRIIADGVTIAEHRFEYSEATGANIRRHIGEDGEINTEMRAVMTENRLPKMSLDDLLAYQGEDEEERRRQS